MQFEAVLRIHEILVYGSGSADPYLWLIGPDPDPISDLQDVDVWPTKNPDPYLWLKDPDADQGGPKHMDPMDPDSDPQHWFEE